MLHKAYSDSKEGASIPQESEACLSRRFSQETLGQEEYIGCENRKPRISGVI